MQVRKKLTSFILFVCLILQFLLPTEPNLPSTVQ